MKKILIIILFSNTIFSGIYGQYLGGISIGNTQNISNLNLSIEDGQYKGGTGIGQNQAITNLNLSRKDGNYEGGDGNGIASIAILNTFLATPDGLYAGGTGKGENNILLKNIRLSRCNDAFLVWNGNQSVFWNNATNWDCGTVPINTSIVSIPANATRMPVIAAGATAARVTVLPNATINLIGAASSLTLTGQ